MTITQRRMTCKCGHVFDAEMLAGVPIQVWTAAVKAVRCPECGGGYKKLFFGGAHKDSPAAGSSIDERSDWWRNRGEIGTSSLTIWCAFTGKPTPHRDFNWPLDPYDFRRCKMLLDLIPEWRAELSVVTKRFPWMAPFVDRWSEFETLYAEEAPSGSCEKLYDLMKVAEKEAGRIRGGAA